MSELELDEQAEILINPEKAKQTIKPLIQVWVTLKNNRMIMIFLMMMLFRY